MSSGRIVSDISTSYLVPRRIRLARWILRSTFRGLFHILSRVQIIGRENIPRGRAYLIAVNHVSLYDPPFILAFWPVAPEAVGAADVWQRPGQSTLIRLYGGIPVHRGQVDRQLIDRMLAALKSGNPVLIAPEGGRSHTPGMRRALPGVAYVVEKANVPVLPVGIVGTTDDYFQRAIRGGRPLLEMRIGSLLHLPPVEGKGEERRAARQRNVDLIMKQLATLLPAEYQGVYASDDLHTTQTTN